MYQTPFADKIHHAVGIATVTVGNITTAAQVNTILLQGRADLVALARPHLANPYFTLHAAAHYGFDAQFWPTPYLTGKRQLYRLAQAGREEWTRMRIELKPPSHKVQEEGAREEEAEREEAVVRGQ
jgi:anthraniloyl-CoA monooxygenase